MTADNRNELPRMIKQQRVMRGLTLERLSEMSGVSTSHLGRVERGERFPSATTLRKIANPLGLDETELPPTGGYPPIPGSTEAERPNGLKTRVFKLCNGKYANLSQLAKAMGVSVPQVYRVRQGKRNINQEFILGAVRAFPGHKLDDLFYVAPEGAQNGRRLGMSHERARQIVKENPTPQKPAALGSKVMLTTGDVAQLLRLHPNTVRRWCEQGLLKSYRISRRGDRRFRREDVDAFLKEGEIE